jgi:hypothetical protein
VFANNVPAAETSATGTVTVEAVELYGNPAPGSVNQGFALSKVLVKRQMGFARVT